LYLQNLNINLFAVLNPNFFEPPFLFINNNEMIKEIIGKLPQLKKALNLNDDTKICFGPKDSPLEGIEYPRHCSRTLKELLK